MSFENGMTVFDPLWSSSSCFGFNAAVDPASGDVNITGERVGIGATCEYAAILIGDVSDGRLDVGTWTYSDSANDQLNGVLEVDVNPFNIPSN